MTNQSCDSIAELLVAYSDGELPDADAERVAAHVAECRACRSELRLLERSLDLAQQLWHESAAGASVPETGPIRPAGRRILAAACVLACAVVLTLLAGYWLFSDGGRENETARLQPPTLEEQGHHTPPVPKEADTEKMDIEAIIAREGRAARLAVTVQLLGTQPGLEEYREQAEQYLRETYGVVTTVGPGQEAVPN